MSNEQIFDREYTRIREGLNMIASSEVLDLVNELELAIEGQCIAKEVKALKDDYRQAKEGV